MAVRLLGRSEWEDKLRAYKCLPLDGKDNLNSAEWWKAPWGASPFTVPVEGDGQGRATGMLPVRVAIAPAASRPA
jgi:hypothetical protein